MDKKVLVSLMMTAPVAAFAQANWTSPGSGLLAYSILPEGNTANWTPDALVDLTTEGGALVCPVSVKELYHNAILPVGKWGWECETLTNAIIYINDVPQVKRNDAGQPVDKDGKVTNVLTDMIPLLSFTTSYAQKATLKIQIKPVNSDLVYSVGKLTMTLDFNFNTAKSALQDALNALILKSVKEDDDRQQASALEVKKGELQTVAAGIQKDIDDVKISDNPASLLEIYNTFNFGLWDADIKKASDVISTKINDYSAQVEAYNKDVDTENGIWQTIQDNTAAKAGFLGEVTSLQDKLDAKKSEIDDIIKNNPNAGDLGDYCKKVTSEDIAAAQTAIDNYKAAINAAYSNLEKPNVVFESQNQAISEQIAAISYAEAAKKWNNYNVFLNGDKDVVPAVPGVNDVQNSYVELFALINNVYDDFHVNTEKYPSVYDDEIGKACVDLAKIYDNNQNYKLGVGELKTDNQYIDDATDENLADAQAQIEDRIEAMKKVYVDLKALVEDQEDQLKKANTQIEELQKALDAQNALTENGAFDKLSQEDQDMITEDLEAWQKAIDNLQQEAEDEYKKHVLNVEGEPYTGKVEDVDAAKKKFNDDAADRNLTAVLQLISDLESAKAYVKNQTEASKISKYNLADKFNETFENIEAAIDKYYNDKEPSAAAKSDIEAAIGKDKDKAVTGTATGVYLSCDRLVEAFVYAVDQIAEANAELVKFDTAIQGKTVVEKGIPTPAYDKDNYKYVNGDVEFTYDTAKEAVDQYDTDLTDIAKGTEVYGNPYEAYQGALKVQTNIKEDAYATNLPLAVVDFENTVTKANLEALNGLVEYITELVTPSTENKYAGVPGMPTPDNITPEFGKDYKGYKSYDDASTAVNNALGNQAALKTCDTNIQLLIDAYQTIYDQIEKAKANKDAYDDLMKAADVVQEKLQGFMTNIPSITVDPAATHYMKGALEIQNKLNKDKAEITDSYEEITEVADKPDHTTHLNDRTKEIKELEEKCRKNQEFYDAQVEAAKAIANQANDLIETLNEIDDVEDNLNKYLKDIDAVKDQLAEINVDLTVSFGNGDSESQNPTYQARFDELQKQLEAIATAEDNGYKAVVEAANNAYIIEQGLVISDLNKEYNDAIAEVNEYRYDISNKGYYNALMQDEQFVKNHERLQDCYKRIAKLQSDLNTFKAALTNGKREDYTVLEILGTNDVTRGGINLKDLIEEDEAISVEIAAALLEVNKAATDVAKVYYNGDGDGNIGLVNKAQGYYDDVVARLTKALTGEELQSDAELPEVVANAVKTATDNLAGAITAYDALWPEVNEETGENEPAFILGMSDICDKLDKVIDKLLAGTDSTDKFVFDIVSGQWSSEYTAALETLEDYLSKVQSYNKALDPDANEEAIENAKTDAITLNTDWGKLNKTQQEDQYFDYYTELQKILTEAKSVVDEAKKQHDTAIKNSDALKVLLTNDDSFKNNTQNALDDLLAWSGYHDDQLLVVAGLQNQIDALVSEVESDEDLNANLESFKTKFTDIQDAIEAAYATVFSQEISFANDLMVKARSAFNNVKLNLGDKITDDQLNEYDSQIKALRGLLDPLSTSFQYSDRVAKMNQLRRVGGIEDQLATIINTLESEFVDDEGKPLTDTFNATLIELDNEYNPLNGNLTTLNSNIATEGNANGEYGSEVAEKYAPQAQALSEQLTAIHAAYIAAGTDVIADADKYLYEIGKINEQYKTLLSEWNSKIATAKQYYASDKAYDSLIEQLNELEQQTAMANRQSERYNMPYWGASYEAIMVAINGADGKSGERKALLVQKESHALYADSPLPANIVEDVFNYVHNVLGRVAYAVKENVKSEIGNEITNVVNPGSLNGYQVNYVDPEALIAELRAEYVKANAVDVASVTEKAEGKKVVATTNQEAIENYESVIDELNGILDAVNDIVANADEDNRFIKGDLTGEGSISIADAQKMTSLILRGTTYDALVEEGDARLAYAADIIDNSKIDIADYTALINMILHPASESNGARKISSLAYFNKRAGLQAEGSINIVPVAEENGIRTYAVEISSPEAFVAGQIDFIVESTSRIVDIRGAERLENHSVEAAELGNSTRVVITSEDNAQFDGAQGVTLYVDVDGRSGLGFDNAIFADESAQAYTFAAKGTDTTGVDSLYEGAKAVKEAVYDAAGRMMNKVRRGINIIRHSNGNVTKEMHK